MPLGMEVGLGPVMGTAGLRVVNRDVMQLKTVIGEPQLEYELS